jgi:hypothetical protein
VYEVRIQKVQLVKIRYFSQENEIRVAVEILVPAYANLLFKCVLIYMHIDQSLLAHDVRLTLVMDVHVRVHVHVMHPGQATKPKCLGRRVQHVCVLAPRPRRVHPAPPSCRSIGKVVN